jgi:PKD repeat protein
MSAAASSDPEGGALTHHWEFGDGTTATGATVSKTYAQSWTYTVTLTVTDLAGAASTVTTTVTTTVNVVDVPPTATLVAPAGVRLGARFTLALTNASDVAPKDHAAGFSYQFDCGLGWFGSWTTSSSMSCPATWTTGTHNVRARVRDRWDYGHREYSKVISVTR